MPTQEQLRTLSLAGLACLQTKYEQQIRVEWNEFNTTDNALSNVEAEILRRGIIPLNNYPKERNLEQN